MTKYAKHWYHRVAAESDIFNKFVCTWISFNSLYGTQPGKTEREQISSWSKVSTKIHADLMSDQEYEASIMEICKYDIPKDYGGKKSLVRCRDKNDISLIILSVYQIRCNLFHGKKESGDATDIAYVTTANKILFPILKKVLSI